MKKTILASALVAFAAMTGVAHAEPLGYPGSTWSVLTINPSPLRGTPEDNNILLQGNIEQGVDWMRLGGGKWRLNSYVQLGYSADKNGLAYNNKLSPAIGTKLSHDFDNGVLDLGIQVVHQNTFRGVTTGPSTGTGVQVYASYWFGWNLKK